jgi:putative hydrolase of the HAD superfamily
MGVHTDPIRAVSFDVWETLLFESDGANQRRADVRSRNLANALNRLCLQVSAEMVSEAIAKMVSSMLKLWEQNRDVSCVDQIALILRNVSMGSLDMRQEWVDGLVSSYASSILEVRPHLNPDARNVLKKLKKRHMAIGLICNTGLTPGVGLRRFLAEEGVARFFDLMLFSEEIGIRKPDPKIFHLATQKLGVQPFEMVHVGDNLRADVWGARNAGVRAIHFSSQEGRDRVAESDPGSLVSLSRRLGNLTAERIVPDLEISSLSILVEAIEYLEKG